MHEGTSTISAPASACGAHDERELGVVADGDADAPERGLEHPERRAARRCPSRARTASSSASPARRPCPPGVNRRAALTLRPPARALGPLPARMCTPCRRASSACASSMGPSASETAASEAARSPATGAPAGAAYSIAAYSGNTRSSAPSPAASATQRASLSRQAPSVAQGLDVVLRGGDPDALSLERPHPELHGLLRLRRHRPRPSRRSGLRGPRPWRSRACARTRRAAGSPSAAADGPRAAPRRRTCSA